MDSDKELEVYKDKNEITEIKSFPITDKYRENVFLEKIENDNKAITYRITDKEGREIAIGDEKSLTINEEYIKEKNDFLKEYGDEYLISERNYETNNVLEKIDENINETDDKEKDSDEIKQENKKEDNNEKAENIDKMEEDLGCDITSLRRIDDENFSEQSLGHQTGHKNKYLAYSTSRNTFILIGENGGMSEGGKQFEEIEDLCGAQGGVAASKTVKQYDENGNEFEVDSPAFVMKRKDGTDGMLAIDMEHGSICLSNLTPDENDQGKYKKQEINIGHTIRPTVEEVEEKEKLEALIKEKKDLESKKKNSNDEKEKEKLEEEIEDTEDEYERTIHDAAKKHGY